MRIALDTNVYSALSRGDVDETMLREIEDADAIAIPVPVLAELYSGFECGTLTRKNIADLKNFLLTEGVEVLQTTLQTVEIYAKIYNELRQAGTPVPVNDLWIAALVAENGFTLCTKDKHFRSIEGLPVLSI